MLIWLYRHELNIVEYDFNFLCLVPIFVYPCSLITNQYYGSYLKTVISEIVQGVIVFAHYQDFSFTRIQTLTAYFVRRSYFIY